MRDYLTFQILIEFRFRCGARTGSRCCDGHFQLRLLVNVKKNRDDTIA